MVAASCGCCSLVVRPEPWRRPNHEIKKYPLVRGYDNDGHFVELDDGVLDGGSFHEDPGAVIGQEGLLLIVPDVVDVQFVFFFYNVGSHNVLFKMDVLLWRKKKQVASDGRGSDGLIRH